MTVTIDYYLALSSPWTYLGNSRLQEIARAHGAAIAHRPVDLGKVFPVSGGLPLPKRAPQRQKYRMAELARWRDLLGAPLTLEPKYFPVDATAASLMTIAADLQGEDVGPLVQAILGACWAEERDIADPATLKTIADDLGMDGQTLLEATKDEDISRRFDAFTQEAIARDVFGSPTYIIEGQLFWGQDRLDFVERAVASQAAVSEPL